MSGQGFEFRDLEGDDLPGWTLRLLIRSGKTTAAHVAHKLKIRAQILRDIAPVVSVTGPGLPAIRGKNLEWAANELEIAGETIVALASTVPRTAQDERNEAEVVALRAALEQALDCKGSYNGTVSQSRGDPAICPKCAAAARAALAREEQT